MMGSGRNSVAKGSNLDKEVGKPNPYPKNDSSMNGGRGKHSQGSANGGGTRSLAGIELGTAGSGHSKMTATRSSTSGYSASGKQAGKMRAGKGTSLT